MPTIQPLEPVKLRVAWPHEAHDFTPWLAENIDRLGDKLNLILEQVQTEVKLPRVGRVDLCARQAGTGAMVVIENQLGESDDSHCLRLLGYAAGAEASILVWVARDFTAYHKGILEWLNEADTIDVYAVKVRAFRVGDTLAASFDTVVEPSVNRSGLSTPEKKRAVMRYAEFYRPLAAQLRQSQLLPMGKGGWRGRYRSFQTGCAGSLYATSWIQDKPRVFLLFFGNGCQQRYDALLRHREQIDEEVKGDLVWQNKSEDGPRVMLERSDAASWTASKEELENVRQWMAQYLLQLRDVIRPHLNARERVEVAAFDEVGDTG